MRLASRLASSVLAALVLTSAGCGGGSPSADEVLDGAVRSLSERRAGEIELSLTASTPRTDPVGFETSGRYSVEDHPLVVLDLTHRRLLGDEAVEARVVSDGKTAWLVASDEVRTLDEQASAALRVGGGRPAGVPSLDLASWARGAEVSGSGDERRITGEVDASAFVSDLQQLAAEAAGRPLPELEAEAAERIDEAARSSELEIVVDEGGALRRLAAVVDFAGSVPEELEGALGDLAAARLELRLSVADVDTPLEVERPES